MPLRPRFLPALLGVLLSASAHAADLQYYPLTKGAAPSALALLDDGKLWYGAEGDGALVRFDPQSGQNESVSLGKGSAPRAVIAGLDGEAWVADSGLNALVRVDPERLGSETLPLPKEAADAGLDSLVFDDDHDIWFTGANGFYGRLDPDSRKLDVWPAPGGKGPHGLAVTPDGQVWYASSDDNSINRIDPLGEAVTRIPLPTAGSQPLQLGADSIGRLWVSEPGSGSLGRFDPSDGKWKSWRLPGDNPQPCALYVDAMDRVWLSDLAGNAILRFDVQSEKFTLYPGDSTAAQVRRLDGRPGEVWGADASGDRLLVIRE
ncbi:Vgb family protein [Pseudomonas citronellolis]|uniref:Vgb family protein n=1 Tax=Pseudomonas citronellolis TaxID=53408 RepID=UPI0023E4464D|nr:lyase [Pseudomonas citronellolis]MDF3937162.1 lyase [Pseudomonas citronellolis]